MQPDRTRRTSVAATTDARNTDPFDEVQQNGTPGDLEERVLRLEVELAKLKQRRRRKEPVFVAEDGRIFISGSGWLGGRRAGAA